MADEQQQTDRRIERTRIALRHALIALMAECGWDQINIRELCARANVGRSTFYHHFRNKEELLADSFEDLRAWLLSHAHETGATASPLPFVRGLIEHVKEQRVLFRTVIGRRSGHVVQKRFREMITRLVKESRVIPGSGWQREAAICYIAGALVEMLSWWIDNGVKQTVDEIEAHFYALTLPVLHQPMSSTGD